MVVNGRPMKRLKRRVTADLNDFLTFPEEGNISGSGPFRTTVKAFLSKHALLPPPSSLFPHLLTWQILFRVGDLADGDDSIPSVVCLDVIEEDVARSRSVYCDQCRVVGWSSNPVCAKRFHFIIKADGNSIGGYNKSCAGCGDDLHLSESRCKSCNHVMTTEDVEDWMYHQLEDTSHLLHGVIHANGYGHLLRVNGREGGSRVLSGSHIMNFWDRLCKVLGARLERGDPMVNANTNENRLPCTPNFPSEEHLRRDLKYLYECMLNPLTMSNHIPLIKREVAVDSATTVLDCKQFMKVYQPERFLPIPKSNAIQVLCEVDIMEQSDVHSRNPPPELLILPSDATISDLKAEASRTFQDVYLMFRRFQVDELVGYGGVNESTQVKLLLGASEFVTVKGKFQGKNGLSRYRMERGMERWTVDCFCGAKDDDGERMLACDVCGVWQHTRCAGIPDLDAVPAKFICLRCRCVSKSTNTTGNCKDESVAGVGLGKNQTHAV